MVCVLYKESVKLIDDEEREEREEREESRCRKTKGNGIQWKSDRWRENEKEEAMSIIIIKKHIK